MRELVSKEMNVEEEKELMMDLSMNFDGQSVSFYLPKPSHIDWIVGTYFKEFRLKLDAMLIKDDDHLAVIKLELKEAFHEIAEDPIQHKHDGKIVFTFRYKQSAGPALEEFFMTLARSYGGWLVEALKSVNSLLESHYEIDVHLHHVYARSNIMRISESTIGYTPFFTTTIENQPVRVHFNTNDEFNSHCYVDHYAVKMDISHLTNTELRLLKERLSYRLGRNARCIYGLQDGELIYFMEPTNEMAVKTFFKNIHELPRILDGVINSWKEILGVIGEGEKTESSSLDLSINDKKIPYILEVSIVNYDEE